MVLPTSHGIFSLSKDVEDIQYAGQAGGGGFDTTNPKTSGSVSSLVSPSTSRYVVVCVLSNSSDASYALTSVAIGGITATQIIQYNDSNRAGGWWYANVPTGTSVTVEVTSNATNNWGFGCFVWSVSQEIRSIFATADTTDWTIAHEYDFGNSDGHFLYGFQDQGLGAGAGTGSLSSTPTGINQLTSSSGNFQRHAADGLFWTGSGDDVDIVMSIPNASPNIPHSSVVSFNAGSNEKYVLYSGNISSGSERETYYAMANENYNDGGGVSIATAVDGNISLGGTLGSSSLYPAWGQVAIYVGDIDLTQYSDLEINYRLFTSTGSFSLVDAKLAMKYSDTQHDVETTFRDFGNYDYVCEDGDSCMSLSKQTVLLGGASGNFDYINIAGITDHSSPSSESVYFEIDYIVLIP